ncbi:delta-lactam-biosynthetic de-N-acetylase [Bacillaceae bacterium Marseille-Q3522]|nr:delta-lactam-biosynthetic de-N-acetylase [Bacillaceae bacterium Marseille-Q3522]
MKITYRHCLVFLFLSLFSSAAIVNAHVSNEPIHWGIKKAKDEIPAEAGEELDSLLNKYGAFYKEETNEKTIYLTFDNGYENGYTGKILDVLKQEKVSATFFVTGHYVKSAPELVKRMADEGHIVGNHSWSHPDLTKVSDEKLSKELEKVRTATEKLTGQQSMAYLRPPRGILSERTLALAQDEGYIHVLWSLAFIDWKIDQQKGWKYAYDQIMKQIHPGAILLLHTVSKDNAEALQKAIQDLKKRGYTFKSLDELVLKREFKNPMLY